MSFEYHRKRLLANPRQWGDNWCVPSAPSAQTPKTRENFDPPIIETETEPDFHYCHHPSPSPEPPAGPYLRIPIPPSTNMISTKGWSLNSLINQSINFHRVPRVSVLSDSLLQCIDDYEKSGVPLVIEECHKHRNWGTDKFTLDSFASTTSKEIKVRNVHDWQDFTIPLSDFITKSRSIATFTEEGEQERFYGKDVPCPKHWEEWLRNADVVPKFLLSGGPQDFFRYRPETSRVETLMCYLGVGDTFTPCHKDLCASSGQNLMCHTENNGSSFWFMTESASALEVAKFFQSLGRELDHEDYVITVEELSKAPFKVYILEQKLGDMVLVPPRSAHQVVNFGGITVKTSWSRMSLEGLVTAYHLELPIYRRVCRPEIYQVKSTIRYVLMGLTTELHRLAHTNGQEYLVTNIKELLVVFDRILAEEESDTHKDPSPEEAIENIECDICGADIFQGFFECRTCVEVDSADGGYVVCPGCYAEGRSCKHQIMQPMQRHPFKYLLDTRKEAIKVVDMYEKRYGRTFHLGNDYCDINNRFLRTFRAALVLLDNYKTRDRVCTVGPVLGGAHAVPSSWALYCKMCHNSKCFPHVLSEHRTHSVEALLLTRSDKTHQKYHYNHTTGRKARFEISMADLISGPLELPQMAYYAIHFTHCKPIKPRFMKLGWYDANASIQSQAEMESQSQAEMESTLVPDATVSRSAEKGPIAVEPPTNNTPELPVKRTLKRKVYVLLPKPRSHQRSQANSSTSALLVIRDKLQSTDNKPEQREAPSQVVDKVPKAPTVASTPSLSDIGISIPTTVRMPGSFILHTSHVITQSIEHLVEPVKTLPHVANPVTAQGNTKGSLATLKFNKKPIEVKPTSSSSNNTTIVASTDTKGDRNSPSLPQSQPQLQPAPFMPLPEVSNALTELTAQTIADRVIHKLTSNPGQPMSSFNTLSNSGGNAQTYRYYRHPQQQGGPPPQYNGPPHHYDSQQHIGSHYRRPQQRAIQFVHYRPPQQHNGQRPQHNGPPLHFNFHEDKNSDIHYPYDHPQRLDNYHASSYPAVKRPQFRQDNHRSPQKQGPVRSPGYVNRSQDHHNGRNMSGKGIWFKERPYKKRKYNGFQDSQSQIRRPITPPFNHDSQPPKGPRGEYYYSTLKHSTSQRVEYHDGMERSTSRDHQQSPWGTNSEGSSPSKLLTQSEYFETQVAGSRGYYRQHYTSNLENNSQSHYSSIEPETASTQGRTNDSDAKDDVTDVGSYDITPLEAPLPMADNPRIEKDGDSVMDDLSEAGIPVDPPVPTVGDQGNDEDWEDGYEMEDTATEVLSAPQPALRLAPAKSGSLDSIFNVADDSMADVTDNPWMTSP